MVIFSQVHCGISNVWENSPGRVQGASGRHLLSLQRVGSLCQRL
ncbi:unnamed protein product, partial [Linum tenue]